VLIPFISGKRHSYAQITEAVQMCLMYRNTLWPTILFNVRLTMFVVIVNNNAILLVSVVRDK